MPSALADRSRTSRARRFGRWLRYAWPKVLAHLMLIAFGLANLYPFFWMLGTSVKANAEASDEPDRPLPNRKYKLADGFDLEAVLPKALVDMPAGARPQKDALAELHNRLKLLHALRTAPHTTTPRQYATIGEHTLPDSRKHLDDMVRRGLLVALPCPADAPEDAECRYQAVPAARGRIYRGLYPRQILTLWQLRRTNLRRAESQDTFADDSRTAKAYATHFGLPQEQARAELNELKDRGFLVDGTLQWINYWVVLKEQNFLLHFATTLVVTILVVLGTVLISSTLGYALARLRFPGRMLVLGLMIAGAVAPREAVIIPIFKMLKAIGLLENLWGMIVWMVSSVVGNALLMAGFFLTLPREVEEAASVDGAGTFRTFFDVALPMARPIVMTVGLFAFLGAWNNFLVPLLCTVTRPSMQPLAVAVYNFQRGQQGHWHLINAAASVMVVPVILLFLMVQRHVVKAIAVGAVKG